MKKRGTDEEEEIERDREEEKKKKNIIYLSHNEHGGRSVWLDFKTTYTNTQEMVWQMTTPTQQNKLKSTAKNKD